MAAPYVEGVKLDVEVADTDNVQQKLKEKVEEHMGTLKKKNAGKVYKLYRKDDGSTGEVAADADYGDGTEASNKIYIGERDKDDHVYITIKAGKPTATYTDPTADLKADFLKEHSNDEADAPNKDKIADFSNSNNKAAVVTALKATLTKLAQTATSASGPITIGSGNGEYTYFKDKACTQALNFSANASDDVLVDGVVIYIAKKS
ncbi:MAG: hypothetical protein ACTTJ7_09340, partial [Treponema sp.]